MVHTRTKETVVVDHTNTISYQDNILQRRHISRGLAYIAMQCITRCLVQYRSISCALSPVATTPHMDRIHTYKGIPYMDVSHLRGILGSIQYHDKMIPSQFNSIQ